MKIMNLKNVSMALLISTITISFFSQLHAALSYTGTITNNSSQSILVKLDNYYLVTSKNFATFALQPGASKEYSSGTTALVQPQFNSEFPDPQAGGNWVIFDDPSKESRIDWKHSF